MDCVDCDYPIYYNSISVSLSFCPENLPGKMMLGLYDEWKGLRLNIKIAASENIDELMRAEFYERWCFGEGNFK